MKRKTTVSNNAVESYMYLKEGTHKINAVLLINCYSVNVSTL